MTRLDHTNCGHAATPKDRAWCRTRRTRQIKAVQVMFLAVADSDDSHLWREYEAAVEILSFTLGMPLRDTYTLVEEGPVL